MANPKHLKILKLGMEAWNDWREENPGILPDLKEAALFGADLRSAQLRSADLRGAILLRANMQDADLTDAQLGAFLMDADLQGACLVGASLGLAVLNSADLREAQLGWTTLGDVDLSETKGVEEIEHVGPSYISTAALMRTASGFPKEQGRQRVVEAFFRDAGAKKHAIEYFRSLIGQPLEFRSCFISYNHRDRLFARRLYDQLKARGIPCWLDEKELKPGDRILDVLDDAIRLHDKLLLCCSESSLNSRSVKDEIRKARERERKDDLDIIIPLMVDHYLLDGWQDGLASDLRSRLAADFTGWERDNARFEEQFEQVVAALRTGEASLGKAPDSKL